MDKIEIKEGLEFAEAIFNLEIYSQPKLRCWKYGNILIKHLKAKNPEYIFLDLAWKIVETGETGFSEDVYFPSDALNIIKKSQLAMTRNGIINKVSKIAAKKSGGQSETYRFFLRDVFVEEMTKFCILYQFP